MAAGILLALATGGCSTLGTPHPTSAAAADPPPAATIGVPATPVATAAPAGSATASTTPVPTEAPSGTAAVPSAAPAMPSAPPTAELHGLAGGVVASADLGSYTWGGGGSDSPWIVGTVAGRVRRGATLQVTIDSPRPEAWRAAWARVVGRQASDPVGGGSGLGEPRLRAPTTAGDWSLSLIADFGPGANAAYFWRITVTP